MRMQQSRFTLMLLGIISIGVIVLIIGFVSLHHQEMTTDKLRKDYTAKKAEYDGNEEKLRNIEQDNEHLAELKSRLAILDSNLADYKYVPTYLQQMQSTTLRTGNAIRSIQPGDCKPLDLRNSPFAVDSSAAQPASGVSPSPAAQDTKSTIGQYQALGINLEVDGSFVSLVRLLDEFRKFPKMIYVKSIDFSPKSQKESNSLTVRMTTYAIITPNQYEAAQSVDGGGKAHE